MPPTTGSPHPSPESRAANAPTDPEDSASPLLAAKAYEEASVFVAEKLLREARRQRNLPELDVPEVCVLDPDGDMVEWLVRSGRGTLHPGWACYHTKLFTYRLAAEDGEAQGREIGVVGCAVGSSFAVLVAEELAASGCSLVVSITSAGRITPLGEPPYFVLIDRALRDEGTSLHYLPPSRWSSIDAALLDRLHGAFSGLDEPVHTGASWTTDAPLRETPTSIAAAEADGIVAVEMEAAALYAYAEKCDRQVVCVAHVTNTMSADGNDFEKGEDGGTHRSFAVVAAIADRLVPRPVG